MPDYTGCTQDKCIKKNTCARFLMKFDRYQSVINPDVHPCEMYWDISKGHPFKVKTLTCKTCNKLVTAICKHGHCSICLCKEHCWID